MWTDETDVLLEAWGRDAQYHKVMYDQAEMVYRKRDTWFGLPIMFLMTLTSSSFFIQMSTSCDETYQVVTGVVAMILSFFILLGKSVGYNDLSLKFHHTAASYGDVVLDIQEKLHQNVKDRGDAKHFVSKIKTTLRELKKAPSLPSHVMHSYLNDIDHHFKSFGIVKPRLTKTAVVNEDDSCDNESPQMTRRSSNVSAQLCNELGNRSFAYDAHCCS